jgi:hypothetical protein
MHRTVRKDTIGAFISFNNNIFRPRANSTKWKSGDRPQISKLGNYGVYVYEGSSWASHELWDADGKSAAAVQSTKVEGQKRIAQFLGGANLQIFISDNGKIIVNGGTKTGDIYIALNAGMTLTLDQFTALVELIFDSFEDLRVESVTSSLQADLDLAKKIQDIRDKYLENKS